MTSRFACAARRWCPVVLATIGALACGAWLPPRAGAHAVLLAASPADGAVLPHAPGAIVIEFNEPVTPISLELRDASGARVALPAGLTARDGVLRAALPRLAPGPYLLTYRVTSLDSHPVGGSLAFAIGAGQMLGAGPEAPADGVALAAARRAVRALHYGALLVAAGATLFALIASPAPDGPPASGPPALAPRGLVAGAAVAAALTAVAGIGLQGATLLGSGAAVLSVEAWRVGLWSTFGTSATVAVGGAAVLSAATLAPSRLGRRARRLVLALGVFGLLASVLLTGHAAVAEPRAVAQPALALHVLAAALWAGSLASLLPGMWTEPAGRALATVERFSRLAAIVVLALVSGALVWSAIEIRELANAWGTAYGRLALAKTGMLAALLVLAALNRFRWLPAWRRGEAAMRTRLRCSIAAELALIAGAVIVTAPLSETPPPAAAATARVFRTARVATAVARVTVTPARPGPNAIAIELAKPDGAPLDAAEVSIEIDNEAASIEPLERRATRTGPGAYRITDGMIPFAGVWTIGVRARINDFDVVALRADIPIR